MTALAVLDTNVWLDWLVFDDPGIASLAGAVGAGHLRPLHCTPMRDELADVLARPAIQAHADRVRMRRGLPRVPIDVNAALARFDAHCSAQPPAPGCGLVCADADDQAFIDLAVACRAQWLLTKDRALLALARQARARHGVEVLTPQAWNARPSATAAPERSHPLSGEPR